MSAWFLLVLAAVSSAAPRLPANRAATKPVCLRILPWLPRPEPRLAQPSAPIQRLTAGIPEGPVPPGPLPERVAGNRAIPILNAAAEETGRLSRSRPDEARGLSGARFDGSGPGGGGGSSDPPSTPGGGEVLGPPEPELPPSLQVVDPGDRSWVANILWFSARSPTARRVLEGIDRLSQRNGRPIMIVVDDLRSNNGEYVYDWEVVRLARHYRKKDPLVAAHTVIHELLHVLQKDAGLPVEALEMEMEAHVVGLRVMRELGLSFERGSFERKADMKLRQGAKVFADWLAAEYDENLSLRDGGIRGYVRKLEKNRDKTKRRLARIRKELERQRAVLAGMADSGQPAETIESYRKGRLGPLEEDLKSEEENLRWEGRDLALLATPEGAARYRAYARRVGAAVRRYHSRYAQ